MYKVELRLMASVWCRLALHCGEQRQQPTLERRRLEPKKDARPHFLLLHECAAQDASKCVGTSSIQRECSIRRALVWLCGIYASPFKRHSCW